MVLYELYIMLNVGGSRSPVDLHSKKLFSPGSSF